MLNLQDPTLRREQCFIGGEWVAGSAWIDVIDPATGEVVARVPSFGTAEVRTAIEAARKAMPGWRARTAKERAVVLRRWGNANKRYDPDMPSQAVVESEVDFIDTPVFKLLIAASLLARPFIETVGPERDLTLPEWRALVALNAKGALTNGQVSEHTGLDAMTISRALDRLQGNGRLVRVRDPDDGRRVINRMTNAGRSTYRAVVKGARGRQEEMLKELSSRDVETLDRTLNHIIYNLKATSR